MAVVHLALVVARVGIGQIADAKSPVAKGLVADDFVSSGVLKRIVNEFIRREFAVPSGARVTV